ncbi:class I adenylate-forming enzyme family protein [Microbacterium sp. X-17]|uniref:class I adenylate-forming enzyme family protein n=1 Tax=Microbacterium sp. X-17 TaxID=3144404 RepID=UPI0031F4ED2C
MRFLERLARRGDSEAVALEDGEVVISYRDLLRAVDHHAVRLQRNGIKAGDRVALIADNSAAYLAVAFSVWRLQAVLVTVFPSSTVEELAYVVDNAQADLVLVDERSASRVEGSEIHAAWAISNSEIFAPTGTAAGELVSLDHLDPDALALICYTSGSTARPKAVMHSASGLSAGAEAYGSVWRLAETDKTIVCLPLAWVYGLTTASMSTLGAGGTVLVLARMKPEQLLEAIVRRNGTFLPGVTTMFVKLTEHIQSLEEMPELASLRLCISGGEPRNETVFARWREFCGVAVHDVFAASECFPVVTYDPVADPEPRLGSAGKVVPGATMRVVGESGSDVPAGEPGEALWRAPAQFLGYWGDDAATEAALVSGWYRTRDFVRVDEAGYVFVLGRLSDMIIRGGANVSPAEVESVLAQIPDIRAAAVFGRADQSYGEEVVAAIVPRTGASLDHDAIRAYCAAHLASFKVPTFIVEVGQLPLNERTGKVDRKAVATTAFPVGSTT